MAQSTFNHVAISVPNAQAAVEFYTQAFGCKVMVPPTTIRTDHPSGATLKQMYGQSLKELVLAIVSLGDGISIEIFEFTDPKYDGPVTTKDWSPDVYTRGGSFHFCLTVADPEAVSTEAVRLGGKLVNNLTEVAPGEKCQYVQDPWGNVIELLSCSHQMLFVKIFAGMATAAGVSLG